MSKESGTMLPEWVTVTPTIPFNPDALIRAAQARSLCFPRHPCPSTEGSAPREGCSGGTSTTAFDVYRRMCVSHTRASGRIQRVEPGARGDLRHQERARECRAVTMSGMERIQAITKAVKITAIITDSASVSNTIARSRCHLLRIFRLRSSGEVDEAGPAARIVSLY